MLGLAVSINQSYTYDPWWNKAETPIILLVFYAELMHLFILTQQEYCIFLMFTTTCFGKVYGHRAVAADYRILVC
jgi:hypothetical protein